MITTFKNATIFNQQRWIKANLTIKNDLIIAIGQQVLGTVINLTPNQFICPGFVDLHAHFRTPGSIGEETLVSGAEAALYGGYQIVCLMANTKPVVDNLNILRELIQAVQTLPVKLRFFSAISQQLAGQQLVNFSQLAPFVVGFSDDGNYLSNRWLLEQALQLAKTHQRLIALHVDQRQLLQPNQVVLHHTVAKQFQLTGVTDNYEVAPLIQDLTVAMAKQLPCHICHISTANSVFAIEFAKAKNPQITCEVTPHHLVLNNTMLTTNDGNYQMNPPVNQMFDQQVLIQALQNSVIDVIATDHAPHLAKTKTDFVNSALGVISLDFVFPLLYTKLVLTNQVSVLKIIQALTIKPAKLIGLDVSLQVGNAANFIIIDTLKTNTVSQAKLKSLAHNTPFLGLNLYGWPIMNVINGQIYNLIN